MCEQRSSRIRRLQTERDNILFVLTHHELSDQATLRLETQLSSIEDELVFLHIDKDQQRQRFQERYDNPKKRWKFSMGDLEERKHWDEYMKAYQDALAATSTDWAPWYVVPADHKWVARSVVADVLTHTIRSLDLRYPEVTDAQRQAMERSPLLRSAQNQSLALTDPPPDPFGSLPAAAAVCSAARARDRPAG